MTKNERKQAMKKEEIRRVLADRDYWLHVSEILGGVKLVGWTCRDRASFDSPIGELNGIVAAKLVELYDRVKS